MCNPNYCEMQKPAKKQWAETYDIDDSDAETEKAIDKEMEKRHADD